jgi:tetratricopeptide repeat protein
MSRSRQLVMLFVFTISFTAASMSQEPQRDRPVDPAGLKGSKDLTAEQWREDLHYFAREFPKTHRNAFHSVKREDFEAAVKRLDERIPQLKRHQIIVEFSKLVAMIGDGHTCFHSFYEPVIGFRRYPVSFYWFSDGLYVRAADPRYAAALGGRVVKLGRASAEEALRAATTIDGHDNDMWPKQTAPWRLSTAEVVDALGLTDDMEHTPLTVEKDGKQVTVVLTPESVPNEQLNSPLLPAGWLDTQGNAGMLWQKDLKNPYWYQYLPEHHSLYVQFNAVANKPDISLADFFQSVFDYADSHPVDRMVLDMRNNGGGNNYLPPPLIKGIMRSPKLNPRGRVYVIIGRHTFSAAQNTVNWLKKWTDVIFVGEPTGSSPNQFGDAVPVRLPHSGIAPYASTVWWQDVDERRHDPWVAPDVSVEMSGADYRRGYDPILEAALTAGPEATLAEQARAPLAKNDLEALRKLVRDYRSDPHHKYANFEDDFNILGYELMGKKELEKSIGVLELNAESYPASFNTWDSLAEALMNHGDKQKAIEYYEKSLALNPQNANAVAMLAKLKQ